MNREAAEALAVRGLGFLAADAERIGRFLAIAGIDPSGVRAAARSPGFLAGVLSHVMQDEELLVAFAKEIGEAPQTVAAAAHVLGGPGWERDVP